MCTAILRTKYTANSIYRREIHRYNEYETKGDAQESRNTICNNKKYVK